MGQRAAEVEERLEHRNDVFLVGRVAAVAAPRTLPSGDVMTAFRLVVDRPEQRRREATRRSTVDTLDCVAWRADVRRTVSGWAPGDVVEVSGALRRRFWRSPAGPASRWEVEVGQARRLSRSS